MNTVKVGKNIRKARLEAGLTQQQVHKKSGIEMPRLSRYENGYILPTLETIEVLAKALRVDPKTLVGWK